jgi:hypothetical protein
MYSQNFTLLDIFNNKKLKNKLPIINYRETMSEDGKTHSTTRMKSLGILVYETSKSSAKPYYNPLKPSKSGNQIIISGELTGELESVVNAVYNGLMANKRLFEITVNNADMIRTALKESQRIKKRTGIEPKLFLNVGSMQEIETMSKRQLNALLDDIMRNIFYNEDFAYTQEKYNVKKIVINRSSNYDKRKRDWLKKVGAV